MESISFEWDAKKSKANLSKHNVSFDEVQTVVFDSHARMIFDPDHSNREDRFILPGMRALLRVLIVCHCCRKNDGKVIRIISARKANRKEQKQYESYLP
jgi:uncharacterized DUF497 family protein